MFTGSDLETHVETTTHQPPIATAKVLEAVDEIVNSRLFRTSPQCQKLLRYVVVHTLEGRDEELKERVIGSEVFGRPQDYNTADDPVVRTRAADVRKRLAVYYQEEGAPSSIRITIPPGSYRVSLHHTGPSPHAAAPAPAAQLSQADPPEFEHTQPHRPARFRHRILLLACVALLIVTVASVFVFRSANARNDSFNIFWAPVSAGSRPPIIYVGSSAVYRMKDSYLERYQAAHPDFKPDQTGREFTVPISPRDSIAPSELVPDEKSFVTVGDVAAAVAITSMLAERKQPYDLRIGRDVVFGDFRTTPVILIGAFNNSWTIELNDTHCFAFGADNSIHETKGQHRVWRTVRNASGEPQEDYALISREISPKSGKFVFTVAGLDLTGTRAAAEFVRDPARMDAVLKKLPRGWQDRNLQLVLHTNVLDDIPSGTQVIASCLQ